jgi:MFS family permease
MPIFAQDLGLSTSQLGIIVASMGLTRLVVNVPAAYIAEKKGRKILLVGGPILTSISMFGTALSHVFMELVMWRIMTGAGGAAQITGSQLYLSDISTKENRARTLAPSAATFQIGFALGPSLSGFIAESYGLRAPFYFVGGATMLAALSNYLLLPETKIKQISRSREDSKSVKEQFADVFLQWKELWQQKDLRQALIMHTTFWLTCSGCQFTLLPLLAINDFGYTAGTIGWVFTAFSLIGVAGTPPAAWIADKFGRKAAMVPGGLIISLCCLATPLISTNEEFFSVICAWSIGNTLFGSASVAYVSDISTPESRAQSLAMLRQAGDLGLVLGAGAISIIADTCSFPAAFIFNSALLASITLRFAKLAKDSISSTSAN